MSFLIRKNKFFLFFLFNFLSRCREFDSTPELWFEYVSQYASADQETKTVSSCCWLCLLRDFNLKQFHHRYYFFNMCLFVSGRPFSSTADFLIKDAFVSCSHFVKEIAYLLNELKRWDKTQMFQHMKLSIGVTKQKICTHLYTHSHSHTHTNQRIFMNWCQMVLYTKSQ